ncbi:ABC transporter substrate-binding protein [Alcaligenaceae bacterium CGII-47]|nr:ABC transporter substrate-binding protein [Alcaligenaceae bacterium CGII-47]
MKYNKSNTNISTRRRSVILSGGALIGSAALGIPMPSYAQTEAIKIGHLTPLTGFLGTLGEYAVMGIRLATEEINADGGVLGRQIDVISEDSVSPQVASSKAQRMIERDHVVALLGETNSASALVISQVAARNKTLFLNCSRSDVLRGKDCNRYMFHLDIPVTVEVNAIGEALLRDGMITDKKIYALTADYLFGHDLSRAAKRFFAAHGGNLIADELVATDATDFSPYLLKIRRAQPDFIACNLAGTQVTNFVKQYAEFGLTYPMAGFNLNTVDAWAAGPGNLSGIWPTVWHHKLENAGSKAFVERFVKKYNRIPENHAWTEYVGLKILIQAINETKSTDTAKLVAYLESEAEFDLLKARKGYFRSWDHQLMQEAYPFTVKPQAEVTDKQDFLVFGDAVPAADQPLEILATPKSENTCVM